MQIEKKIRNHQVQSCDGKPHPVVRHDPAKVALKVDYGSNASSTDRKNLSTTHYFKNNTEKVQNQKIEDEIDGYNYRVQLVYVEPLPWLHFLQFRYSYQYRANNSDHFVYNWDKDLDEFTPDYDEEASNCFENQYSNHLFNVAVRTSRKKYNYNIGADFEPHCFPALRCQRFPQLFRYTGS